jgi:hypothetical protein
MVTKEERRLKYFRQENRGVPQYIGFAICCSLLSCVLPGNAFAAGPEAAASGTAAVDVAAREEWQRSIAQIPVPNRTSCFKATFPNKEWQEIPCKSAPNRPYPLAQGRPPSPANVGNQYLDAVAQVPEYAQEFYSVTGYFTSGSIATSETGSTTATVNGKACTVTARNVPNIFSLQLNTNTFAIPASSPICGGAAGCSGWQQFVYSSSDNVVFIQYWLLNVGSCPGPGWNKVGGNDCYKNSPTATGPSTPLTITDLPNLMLTGTAASNGDDSVTLTTATEAFPLPPQPDSILGLGQNWNWQNAEFNVFGDGCSTQAKFDAGTILNVRLSLNMEPSGLYGPPIPVCRAVSFTGETNNLSFSSPAQALGYGLGSALVFTETGAPGGPPSCPALSPPPPPPPPPGGGGSGQCSLNGIPVPCHNCSPGGCKLQ